MSKKVKFNNSKSPNFFAETKKRVDQYFETNGLSIKYNNEMVIKSLLIVLLSLGLYALLLGSGNQLFRIFGIYCALGFLFALMGFNIAHDAAHNAYSSKAITNKIFSYFFDFVGLSSYVWNITHNNLHHTYTNIQNIDEDITNLPIFRYTQGEKYFRHYTYQHIYAPFIYSLVGLLHVSFFDHYFVYKRRSTIKSLWKELFYLSAFKLLHLGVFFILPATILLLPWWQTFICYLCALGIGSVFLAIVVSLAHVNDKVAMLEVDGDLSLDTSWAVHEMRTTCNFGTDNRLLNYLVGGLNFQIEHHLFPQICHIHYPKISQIVKQTAHEFGVPYQTFPTFLDAIKSHFRLLKTRGQKTTESEAVLSGITKF